MSTETIEATLVTWHNKSFTSNMSQKLVSSISHGATGTHNVGAYFIPLPQKQLRKVLCRSALSSCMSFCLIPTEKNLWMHGSSLLSSFKCHYVSLSMDIDIRHENALWALWKTRDPELHHHSHTAWCPGYSVINRAVLFDFLNKRNKHLPRKMKLHVIIGFVSDKFLKLISLKSRATRESSRTSPWLRLLSYFISLSEDCPCCDETPGQLGEVRVRLMFP